MHYVSPLRQAWSTEGIVCDYSLLQRLSLYLKMDELMLSALKAPSLIPGVEQEEGGHASTLPCICSFHLVALWGFSTSSYLSAFPSASPCAWNISFASAGLSHLLQISLLQIPSNLCDAGSNSCAGDASALTPILPQFKNIRMSEIFSLCDIIDPYLCLSSHSAFPFLWVAFISSLYLI